MEISSRLKKMASEIRESAKGESQVDTSFEKVASVRLAVATSFLKNLKK